MTIKSTTALLAAVATGALALVIPTPASAQASTASISLVSTTGAQPGRSTGSATTRVCNSTTASRGYTVSLMALRGGASSWNQVAQRSTPTLAPGGCANVAFSGLQAAGSQMTYDSTGNAARTLVRYYATTGSKTPEFTLPLFGLGYQPVTPVRVIDTRNSGGVVAAGRDLSVSVVGRAGVPTGASAVMVSVSTIGPSAAGWVTARPSGGSTTTIANVIKGTSSTNSALVAVGANGRIVLRPNGMSANLAVDICGYVPSSGGLKYSSITPARLLDTRAAGGVVAAGSTKTVQVTGRAGVPASAKAVAVSITVVGPRSSGYLTSRGMTIANFAGRSVTSGAVIPLDAAGRLPMKLLLSSGHLVVDVTGYYGSSSTLASQPVDPVRILDTRYVRSGQLYQPRSVPNGATKARVKSGTYREVDVSGGRHHQTYVPTARAAIVNITVVDPLHDGYLTVSNGSAAATVVNFSQRTTASTIAIVPLNSSGYFTYRLWGSSAHVLVDLVGYSF